MTKPQIKIYEYSNSTFSLVAIVDDYESCSFEHNLYQAGQFTLTINYNIPNAHKFERGLFIQFGNDEYMFGEITKITDSIGEQGKGSQKRVIVGYDARYLFKRRIISNLNSNDNWSMTAKGELCLRNLVLDQCGSNAETKRQLPINNIIPNNNDAIGAVYSVAESYSNLYETLVTIATQTNIGWRIKFDGSLSLECYNGVDHCNDVYFTTDYDSLGNGSFSDSVDSFTNAVYIGGKGTGSDRDIYVGEDSPDTVRLIIGEDNTFLVDEKGNYIVVENVSPSGLDRYESWDNQSQLTTEDEYIAEANSMLTQYMQNISVTGAGLIKSPFEFKKQYNIGDCINIAFSGKSVNVQIQAVTETWAKGQYNLSFSFGKPELTLSRQLQLILKKIQLASSKSETTTSVKWYELPTDTSQTVEEVTCNTLGFTGTSGTFTLYLDDEGNGAKNYTIYTKNLSGTLILTTGQGNTLSLSGNIITRIYVDADGDIIQYT